MSWLQDSKSAILRNQPTCCTYELNPRFRANPDLPEEAQQALRLDFNLDADDTLSLHCRKALIYYTKRRFSLIDPEFNLPRWIPHSVTPDDDEKRE